MTLEPTNDEVSGEIKKSYAVKRKERIKRRNQIIRKRALEQKQKMFGSLSDEERGRLKELQDMYD